MNRRLSSTRNMYQVVINIIILFTSVWSGFAAYAAGFTSFTNKTNQIDDTAEQQQNLLNGYTTNKRKKKRAMADKALVTRGKVAAFASTTGDSVLFGTLKISFSKLFYKKDTTATGYAEIIYNAANAMAPDERTAYDISDEELEILQASITEFKNLPSPAQMRAIRKQLTELLPQLFEEGNAILTGVLDGLMEEYKESNPDFYEQYHNARRMYETHRHTTIEGTATDETTGEDLQNVHVIITSDTDAFEELTDVQGTFKQQIAPEINYKVKFILPDYEPLEFDNINLDRGEHERLNVKLKKIS